MYNPFSLEGKSVLVTGASSGIGREIAIQCSKLGARVLITARNEERLKETMGLLEGDRHEYVIADLKDETGIANLITGVDRIIDGLVNCAGLNNLLPFTFINREMLSSIFEVNFFSPTLLAKQLVKMKRMNRNSSIVFISSVSGVYCSAVGASMYSATKGAVNGVVKGMALDLASKGIRVNCINPGVVKTNIFKGDGFVEEKLLEECQKYPLKRLGEPRDVALAAVYLLSDATCWMTGTNLLIDGGFTLL